MILSGGYEENTSGISIPNLAVLLQPRGNGGSESALGLTSPQSIWKASESTSGQEIGRNQIPTKEFTPTSSYHTQGMSTLKKMQATVLAHIIRTLRTLSIGAVNVNIFVAIRLISNDICNIKINF